MNIPFETQINKEIPTKEYPLKQTATILSRYTSIDETKLCYFLNHFGIEALFYEPDLLGITVEQKEKLQEISDLIMFGGI